MQKAYYFLVWTRVRLPPAPQKPFQFRVKACKINDLQAFVVLLSGEQQFQIVLKTLDTEEATYLWHIEIDKTQLKSLFKIIDEHLSIIQNNGRQTFLDTRPENFR